MDYSDIIRATRPVSTHPQMDIGNRAKEFMPMDALRGFSVAVLTKQREKQLVARITLSEDALELLNRQIRQLKVGSTVTVTYFLLEKMIGDLEIGTYVTEQALVEDINCENRFLILQDAYIHFSAIYKIECEIDDQVCEDEWYDE